MLNKSPAFLSPAEVTKYWIQRWDNGHNYSIGSYYHENVAASPTTVTLAYSPAGTHCQMACLEVQNVPTLLCHRAGADARRWSIESSGWKWPERFSGGHQYGGRYQTLAV